MNPVTPLVHLLSCTSASSFLFLTAQTFFSLLPSIARITEWTAISYLVEFHGIQ